MNIPLFPKKWKIFNDPRGVLFPIEFSDIPFEPKRIFIVKNVPKNTIRGEHAHYETMQYLVCLKGRVLVHLQHNADIYEEVILWENESILIDKMIWDWQEFKTGDDILLVLCSTPFNESDYIRDYAKFKELTK